MIRKRLHSIRAVHAHVPRRILEDLAKDPDIAYISLDRPVAALDSFTVTALDYSNEPINAPAVWAQGFIGTNIGVAVIDSGVTPVPDLVSQSQPPGQPAALQFPDNPNQVVSGECRTNCLQREFRFRRIGCARSFWSWNPRRRSHCGQRSPVERQQLLLFLLRRGPECKHHQPSRA